MRGRGQFMECAARRLAPWARHWKWKARNSMAHPWIGGRTGVKSYSCRFGRVARANSLRSSPASGRLTSGPRLRLRRLGINLDLDRGQLQQLLAAEEIPWTVLPAEVNMAKSIAIRYGITSTATIILVGKDGKVAAVDSDNHGLEEHLRELIGPAAAGPLTCIDLQSRGNWKLSDALPGENKFSLASLPQGEQSFAGLTFRVGPAALPTRDPTLAE